MNRNTNTISTTGTLTRLNSTVQKCNNNDNKTKTNNTECMAFFTPPPTPSQYFSPIFIFRIEHRIIIIIILLYYLSIRVISEKGINHFFGGEGKSIFERVSQVCLDYQSGVWPMRIDELNWIMRKSRYCTIGESL